MRTWIAAGLVAVGVTTVLAAGSVPAPAGAADDLVKCIDCDGRSCHVVHGPAARGCVATPEGCLAWNECG